MKANTKRFAFASFCRFYEAVMFSVESPCAKDAFVGFLTHVSELNSRIWASYSDLHSDLKVENSFARGARLNQDQTCKEILWGLHEHPLWCVLVSANSF